jgi:hypothetical protein
MAASTVAHTVANLSSPVRRCGKDREDNSGHAANHQYCPEQTQHNPGPVSHIQDFGSGCDQPLPRHRVIMLRPREEGARMDTCSALPGAFTAIE